MNFELSFRKTKKWHGFGAYDGSIAKLYLPKLWKIIEALPASWFSDISEDEYLWPIFWDEFMWVIIHELIHNLGIRHTKKWTSEGWI